MRITDCEKKDYEARPGLVVHDLDELVLSGEADEIIRFHLEKMTLTTWWIGLETKKGDFLQIVLAGTGTLEIEDDLDYPLNKTEEKLNERS